MKFNKFKQIAAIFLYAGLTMALFISSCKKGRDPDDPDVIMDDIDMNGTFTGYIYELDTKENLGSFDLDLTVDKDDEQSPVKGTMHPLLLCKELENMGNGHTAPESAPVQGVLMDATEGVLELGTTFYTNTFEHGNEVQGIETGMEMFFYTYLDYGTGPGSFTLKGEVVMDDICNGNYGIQIVKRIQPE